MPPIIRLFALGLLLALPSDNSITLRLQGGPHAPADMPPGVVVINVPVYPRARPWHRPYVMPLGDSTSPYAKVSPQITVLLPTDPAVAQSWYQRAFARRGYRVEVIMGQTQPSASGLTDGWTMLEATSRVHTRLEVRLALQATLAGGTVAAYQASDVTVPPRSPGSYLPGDIVRVQVTYHFLNAPVSERTIHRLVTTRHAIGTLVRAINALPRSDEAAHSCPAIDREASLVFSKPSGPPIRVETDPGCIGVIIVGYPPLSGPTV